MLSSFRRITFPAESSRSSPGGLLKVIYDPKKNSEQRLKEQLEQKIEMLDFSLRQRPAEKGKTNSSHLYAGSGNSGRDPCVIAMVEGWNLNRAVYPELSSFFTNTEHQRSAPSVYYSITHSSAGGQKLNPNQQEAIHIFLV